MTAETHPRSAKHATFVIERVYSVPASRVFSAWSNSETKQRWMSCDPSWKTDKVALDFRIGGRETISVGPAGGPMHRMEAIYYDIVPNERIIYGYEMYIGARRISVSLTTIDIKAEGKNRTRLTFTEQGVFFDDDADAAEREEGTRLGFERLDALMNEPS
jgi:uncharacterized protein YndB with AHSA1/START domain